MKLLNEMINEAKTMKLADWVTFIAAVALYLLYVGFTYPTAFNLWSGLYQTYV